MPIRGPDCMPFDTLGAGTGLHAPQLPFTVPVGIGSMGGNETFAEGVSDSEVAPFPGCSPNADAQRSSTKMSHSLWRLTSSPELVE
jgi:hypothetical protein